MSDDLIINQPVALGPFRVEVAGDRQVALDLLPRAAGYLGQLRTLYDVNARIARGEPGGFYYRTVELADGVTIQVITNNGLDTVRISVPPRPDEAPAIEATTPAPPEAPAAEEAIPAISEEGVNFLAKWPYTAEYENLDAVVVANVSLDPAGDSIDEAALTALASGLTFSTRAAEEQRFELIYDWVQEFGHEDFHRKFMVAAYRAWHDTTGGDDASAVAWSSYYLPYPSLTMPLRADGGFKLAMANANLPVSQQIVVEDSDGTPVLSASAIAAGDFNIMGELVDDWDWNNITDSHTLYSSGTPEEIALRERWEFTGVVANRWSNFTDGWASIGEVDTSTPWTKSRYTTETSALVELNNYATFGARAFALTTPSGISISLNTDSYHYYETTPRNGSDVPIDPPLTIDTHRDVFSAPAFDGFVLPTIPSLGIVVNQSIVAKITASEGYGTFSWIDYYGAGTFSYDGMDMLIEPTSAWPLDSLPSNLFNFDFGNGGIEGTPYAVPPAYVADRTHHSIPFGEMRNGSYADKLITIHWPRAAGYGICVATVPSDYEAQVAALDGDARRTYQDGAIAVVLNNFASMDLIASIHHVGEYAILSAVVPE